MGWLINIQRFSDLKGLRGYIFSRPFFGERVPQRVQNLVLRDYCTQNKIHFLLSFVEYRMKDSYLILNSLLSEIDDIDGIVFYSLLQLPINDSKRAEIIENIIKKRKSMHFALEGLVVDNTSSNLRVENIFKVKKEMQLCYNPDVYNGEELL